jgi:uncharacterized protein Yka (UPF0111/DUF47 family)
VKIRLVPSETRSLDLLQDLCSVVQGCIENLSQLLGAPETDQGGLIEEMARAELRATDLHYALLTHLRSSYVNPLPREDLYTFSRLIHDAVEQLCGAGELMVGTGVSGLSRRAAEQLELLGRQADLIATALRELQRLDDLEDTWIQMVRLAKRGNRTHRAWVGEISELSKASRIIRHRTVADQYLNVVQSLRAVTDHLGRVLVKES